MTQRILENFSAPSGDSSPSWATRCRRETPTMTMTMTMMTRTKATTPNRTTSAGRRSSENRRRRIGAKARATARQPVRLDDWLR